MLNFLPFILRRATRHWQVLFTLIIGVLLATAMLSSGPLLVDTVVELGLRSAILTSDPLTSNLRVMSTSSNYSREEVVALNKDMQALLNKHLGDHLKGGYVSLSSRWLFPWSNGVILDRQRMNLSYQEGMAERVDFLSGGWPDNPLPEDNVFQAVISEEMAVNFALKVGDRLPLSIRDDEALPTAWMEVSGVIRPQNAADSYWFGVKSPLHAQSNNRWDAQYSVFLSFEDYYPANESLFDTVLTILHWRLLLDPESIQTQDIPRLGSGIAGLRADLKLFEARNVLETNIEETLLAYASQSEAVRAPLYLLTAEVALLALYYVAMVSALAVQQVEREFAILGSRGSSRGQLFQIQFSEAFIIGLVALLIGPVLGLALIQLLTIAGPLSDVGQTNWTLALPQIAWVAAIFGALASVVGLLLPIGPALRRSIVSQVRTVARQAQKPLWQRLYLDVFVLVIGLVLLLRLYLYGGIVAETLTRPRVDWLLLLSPVFLLLGSATILLRVFPLILNILEKIAASGRGLAGTLAMWQAARNPSHVARLVLLLTLAMALGILSTGLNATLDLSEYERALYAAGSDLRLVSNRFAPAESLTQNPGVMSGSGVWRGEGKLDQRPFPKLDILALEPYSFVGVTRFREDYAEQPMGGLLGLLVVDEFDPPKVIKLPGHPSSIGIWVWSAEDGPMRVSHAMGLSDLDRIAMGAQLQTARGEIFTTTMTTYCIPREEEQNLVFGCYPEGGWLYFSSQLPAFEEADYPLSVRTIWVQNRAQYFENNYLQSYTLMVAMDDLTVVDARTGEAQVAESFEDLLTIWDLSEYGSMIQRQKNPNTQSGEARLNLIINFRQVREHVGIKLASGLFPPTLPALASPVFMEVTQAEIGDLIEVSVKGQEVPFEIVGVVTYFPTLYDDQQAGFLITQREPLLSQLNEAPTATNNVNEAWLLTDGNVTGASVAGQMPEVTAIWEADVVRRSIKADPMALGLRSVTFFGYLLTATLSLVGFATYFYLSARQREVNYGILRSLGLAPGQLYASLVIEQVILILTGLALGTGLGMLLNQITLPGLPITLGDQAPIPPFYARNDWYAVGRMYLTLALAFLVTLGVATLMLWRARIHRVLRIGEE